MYFKQLQNADVRLSHVIHAIDVVLYWSHYVSIVVVLFGYPLQDWTVVPHKWNTSATETAHVNKNLLEKSYIEIPYSYKNFR